MSLYKGDDMAHNSQSIREIAKQVCRELRGRQTRAEEMFWRAVRNRRFEGKKFNRQFAYFFYQGLRSAFYVIDFYCHELMLAVELDGDSHFNKREDDAERTRSIEASGIRVVRFRNEQVENNLAGVLDELRKFL